MEQLPKNEDPRLYRRQSNSSGPLDEFGNDISDLCNQVSSFTNRQKYMCKRGDQKLLKVIADGAQAAVQECRNQMKGNHWNCTSHRHNEPDALFGSATSFNSREKAFVFAISSAALTSQISRACAKGELTNCGCDRYIGTNNADDFYATSRMENSTSVIAEQPNMNTRPIENYTSRRHRQAFEPRYRPNGINYQRMRRSMQGNNWHNGIGNKIVIRGSLPLESNSKNADFAQIPMQAEWQGGDWSWGGCSHDLRHGRKFSRMFLDLDERPDTIEGFMNRWNNRAGRARQRISASLFGETNGSIRDASLIGKRTMKLKDFEHIAVHRSMERVCKCHGLSGSCTMKVCWRQIPDFDRIGSQLLQKYNLAIKVQKIGSSPMVRPDSVLRRQRSAKYRRSMELPSPIPYHTNARNPTRDDLIYFDEPPSYCNALPEAGILGTKGRECWLEGGPGKPSCSSLCCGRGFNSEEIIEYKKCES
ncbi:Wnt10p [Cichlidogyrus casuarinus]|uniref:Protein Wnt n=1 Tax=Cichlidogyrus casuarinus TaxID=1844966 RepID=A0ABD2QG15_9PLAT